MSDPINAPEPDTVYLVRFTDRAGQDMESEFARLEETQGEALAVQWYEGLRTHAGTLSRQPYRNAVLSDESRWIGREVRRLLFRRTRNSAVYLLYYVVRDDNTDGPMVRIIHIRHSARKPLTAKEAKSLRGEV